MTKQCPCCGGTLEENGEWFMHRYTYLQGFTATVLEKPLCTYSERIDGQPSATRPLYDISLECPATCEAC